MKNLDARIDAAALSLKPWPREAAVRALEAAGVSDLLAEVERLRRENNYLRGLVQRNPDWKCLYGHDVESMVHCPLGFPGCGCADDLLLSTDDLLLST